jgi:hypothetical protein
MFQSSSCFRYLNPILVVLIGLSWLPNFPAQTQRGPSDVVREFYKAMREHRFKDAWSMSVYKPAIDGLTADEMEDLRPFFESQAAPIPAQLQIDGEKITGNTAQVFVQLPPSDGSPQLTSKPVDLIKTGTGWIIGNQDNMNDVLKRLIGMEAMYAQANNGVFGEVKALVAAGLMSDDMFDPKTSGYNFRLTINGKAYVATAEPLHYGRTARLSFWMDQTGAIKSGDNGGKPVAIK